MTTRMSPGGRTGVSPVTLIVVVLLAMIAGTIAFMMYTRTVRAQAAVEKVIGERGDAGEKAEVNRQIQAVLGETGEVRNFLESKRTAEEVKTYFGELDMRGILVDPRNFRKINVDLDLWIMRLTRLTTELSKRVTEAKIQADSAETARDNSRDEYSRRVQQKNQSLGVLDQFLRDELAKKENLVTQYVKEKQDFINTYNNLRDEWEGKKQRLLLQTDQLTRRNAVMRRDLLVLRPEPTIAAPSGRVLHSEWQTKRVIISLGERDKVFPGLGFEVYEISPTSARTVKGKIEIIEVLRESSVAAVIESDAVRPIVAGDAIQTLFLPFPRHRKFVIAGFIPPGAIYDEAQMKAIIKLNGGEVQEAVNLYTDLLILGEITPRGLTEMDEKLVGVAQTEYREGRSEAELARELSVDIVDYREFLQSIQR